MYQTQGEGTQGRWSLMTVYTYPCKNHKQPKLNFVVKCFLAKTRSVINQLSSGRLLIKEAVVQASFPKAGEEVIVRSAMAAVSAAYLFISFRDALQLLSSYLLSQIYIYSLSEGRVLFFAYKPAFPIVNFRSPSYLNGLYQNRWFIVHLMKHQFCLSEQNFEIANSLP